MTACQHTRRDRRGAIGVLILFILPVFVGFVALAVDLGYLTLARTELQRSADSAAMAAAWELIDDGALYGDPYMADAMQGARDQAVAYAAMNSVCTKSPNVDRNDTNSPDGDVVVGTLWNPSDKDEPIGFDDSDDYNVVRVRVRRTAQMNGNVPMFFAGIFGVNSQPMQAEATAGMIKAVAGFRAPGSGENLGILPFALDEDTWNELLARNTPDDWSWDPETKEISSGGDGIHEVNLYPQGTGSPGNRGTVDVGSDNNSTADIARQVTDGVSAEDLEHHGGTIELDENGQLFLNGDTGISAGVKDELASIKGEPKIIPIFSEVAGPGNNAQYTIVKFVGVRILDVKLTGSMNSKRVIIQPATVMSKGVVPAPPEETTSYYIYSYPILIR